MLLVICISAQIVTIPTFRYPKHVSGLVVTFYFSKPQPNKPISEYTLNGPVHIISKMFVMRLATGAEIGAAHMVAQKLVELCTCLIERGPPQPPPP